MKAHDLAKRLLECSEDTEVVFLVKDDTSLALSRHIYKDVKVAHSKGTGVRVVLTGDGDDDDSWVQEATDKKFYGLETVHFNICDKVVGPEFPFIAIGMK